LLIFNFILIFASKQARVELGKSSSQGKNMRLHYLTFLLLVVGGLNWLLVGVLGWDIGEIFGGQGATVSRVIYILVGLSAIYEAATHKGNCKVCGGGQM
jgi:uncharacterized membrane protein YuzA (DUF378 family)